MYAFQPTKAYYYKVCIEVQKIGCHVFPYQSQLLSTIILNDVVKTINQDSR